MNGITEQEKFWQGDFGNSYIDRNKEETHILNNVELFKHILNRTDNIKTILEFGSNIGLNLQALHRLLPVAALSAVEINELAGNVLKKNLPQVDLHLKSILEFESTNTWDLVFTKGVLIHINPEKLPQVYDLMYQSSTRYMLVAEYYNPHPVEINYRGHQGKLFKRDFAGEILQRFSDLSLIDYGFVYHRDPHFPQDDITWFLMEKQH